MSREIALTPRWTPLTPHAGQTLFRWHPATIKVCPAGRRSGKTEIIKRKYVQMLRKRRPWPAMLFLAAPTNDQARSIFWKDIKAMIPKHCIKEKNETHMEITTIWDSMIRVFGLDRPERSEGVPWDQGCIDELANCPARLLTNHLLPGMGTLGRTPSLDLIGVPDEVGPNQAEYEEFWTKGLNWRPGLERYTPEQLQAMNADPAICSFHWRSDSILEPAKIAFYKNTMDPMAYEQEFGGRFITSGGKAFPRFDPLTHVSDVITEYSDRLPLDWSLDFGLHGKGVALLGQAFDDTVWIMDEIISPDSSTDVQVMAFRERCQERGYNSGWLRRFGDAAGKHGHSNTGVSDYEIIDEMMPEGYRNRMERLELDCNPPIKDTINAVRCRLMTVSNTVRLHIHPRCKVLIEQMKTAPWPAKLEEFHCLAALRYYVYRLFGEGMDTGISVSARGLPGV